MPQQDKYKGQQVLVFDSALLDDLGRFQGYSTEVPKYLDEILAPESSLFIDRSRAEEDPRFKQLIPYTVLRCGDEIFRYVRGKEAGEERLRAKGSIGIGGHVEPTDRTLFGADEESYIDAAHREVNEEVMVDTPFRENLVGLINDDSNEVGQVHFGVVHVWDLEQPAVKKRERQITQCGFVSLDELEEQRDELETWSQIALDILREVAV